MSDGAPHTSTREAILAATDKMLARYGYRKMTIDDLAAEVGIGKGSVYLHFESKEEIALSHIDSIVERLKANLRKIADGPGSVEKRLKEMLVERVLFRFDSVQHYSKGLDEMLAVLRPKLLERRHRYFKEGQRGGQFSPGDAKDLAVTFLSATNSLLPYSLSAVELGDRKTVTDRVKKTATILINGIK
jgi:AcrR family transcriptional regulator